MKLPAAEGPCLTNHRLCPPGHAQSMNVGVSGQHVYATDAIPAVYKPGAPLHAENEVSLPAAPFKNVGIVKFMPANGGSHRIKRVLPIHFDNGIAVTPRSFGEAQNHRQHACHGIRLSSYPRL